MIKRISLEEKRSITRAVYEKLGYHVKHFYPYTAIPIRPSQTGIGAVEVSQARKAAEAAIAKAERPDRQDERR